MTERRKRGEARPPDGRLRLSARDEAVLCFVGRAGVVERDIVAAVFWNDAPAGRVAAGRRLRAYTDHGLVTTSVRSPFAANRYLLTLKGAAWAGSADMDGRVLRTRVRADSQSADHLVAIARVWGMLAVRLSAPDSPGLRRFVTEAEVRRATGARKGSLIPDGIAVIGAAHPRVLSLEVDLGQEHPEVVAKKFRKYVRHFTERAPLLGLPLHALLVAAPGRFRLARLALAAHAVGLSASAFFQDLGRLTAPTVLDELATFDSLAEHAKSLSQ
jgi:hypothetical protein